MSQQATISQQRIRFEEVTPAHEYAAFLAVSIESLVAPLGLPLYEGYDDLDEMRLTFLTLPSGETVTLGEYLNCPQPGTSIYVDAAMQNIPQIVFDSCLQLQVPREEVIWFHPDWQEEIDRLYTEHGSIEKRPESSPLEKSIQRQQYEPIDCFNHALRIYTREYIPATYWAMLQHNLGLAYFNRNQGDRRENLERSIECFNKSLEIFTQDEFLEKWRISQKDLKQSLKSLLLLQQSILVKCIFNRLAGYQNLKGVNLKGVNLMSADLSDVDLSDADLRVVNLRNANLRGTNLKDVDLSDAHLSGADLSSANLCGADLIHACLRFADLSDADLSGANLRGANLINANLMDTNVNETRFEFNLGISKSLEKDLIKRGAIFSDSSGDRSESRIPVSR